MKPVMIAATRDEILTTLRAGVGDPGCVLSRLRATPHLVDHIGQLVATGESWWKRCVRTPAFKIDARLVGAWLTAGTSQAELETAARSYPTDDAVLFLVELQDNGYSLEAEPEPFEIEFPPPRDIDVNMMPFLLDGGGFEKSRLPEYLRPYWPIVERCLPRDQRTTGSPGAGICFLTVQESFVEGGRTQRRPGLHVDCPGSVRVEGEKRRGGGSENWHGAGESRRYTGTEWGLGACHLVPAQPHAGGRDRHARLRGFQLEGGIYMASSVENSCRAWNCKIVPEEEEPDEETDADDDGRSNDDINAGAIGGKGKASKIKTGKDKAGKDKSGKGKTSKTKKGKCDKRVRRREAIGPLGNIEHLRHLLPPELAQTMKPNHLYWMTDRTPHESLPMGEGTYRQFFRLVTSRVSLWYEDHSTQNPNGVRPNPKITKIVKGNKFDSEGVVIVE